jgi:hypothetical protein
VILFYLYTWPIYQYLKVLSTLLYNIITTTVTVKGRNIKLIIIPKTVLTTAMTLGLVGNINIANTDLQVVIIGQFQVIVNQFINNSIVLDNKINSIEISKVKMLSVK